MKTFKEIRFCLKEQEVKKINEPAPEIPESMRKRYDELFDKFFDRGGMTTEQIHAKIMNMLKREEQVKIQLNEFIAGPLGYLIGKGSQKSETVKKVIDTVQNVVDVGTAVAGFIPGVNLIASGIQAVSAGIDVAQGDYGDAAFRGAGAAAGLIPGGSAVATGARFASMGAKALGAAKAAGGVAKAADVAMDVGKVASAAKGAGAAVSATGKATQAAAGAAQVAKGTAGAQNAVSAAGRAASTTSGVASNTAKSAVGKSIPTTPTTRTTPAASSPTKGTSAIEKGKSAIEKATDASEQIKTQTEPTTSTKPTTSTEPTTSITPADLFKHSTTLGPGVGTGTFEPTTSGTLSWQHGIPAPTGTSNRPTTSAQQLADARGLYRGLYGESLNYTLMEQNIEKNVRLAVFNYLKSKPGKKLNDHLNDVKRELAQKMI